MNIYRDNERYVALTGDHLNGMRGILLKAWTGDTPESVKYTAFPVEVIDKMTRVDPRDVPTEWLSAFGYTLVDQPELEPEDDVDAMLINAALGTDLLTSVASGAASKPASESNDKLVLILATVFYVGGMIMWEVFVC